MNEPQERPFYPISQYYRQQFGQKVYKISVSIAESCPNRQVNGKLPVCVFCDEWGSAAYHEERDLDLVTQISIHRQRIEKRYRAKQFLVYFQSYTNTFDRVQQLEQRFNIALAQEGVVGLVVGTRPDCLPKRIMPLLKDVHERAYLMVELGVQSLFDRHLDFLQRGHSAARSLEAIERLAAESGVVVGVHLMFGLPGETDAEIIATAEQLNRLPVDNVKLHNLHVLTNTPLELLYQKGEFQPDELAEYSRKVVLFLRHLSPRIAVQRLTAVASRWDELVAPQWTKEKLRPSGFIEQQLITQGYRQGDLFTT